MINASIAGEYIVRKQKVLMENGVPKLDKSGNQIPIGESWVDSRFSNLITNAGLNAMATTNNNNVVDRLTLSTNTSEPSFTDAAILGSIASKVLANAEVAYEFNNSIKPYFMSSYKVFRFDAGVGTGNITKLYIGNEDNSTLWSAALVKDGLGLSAVITKLPDEILDVTYIIRKYLPSDDVLSTVTISGVEYNTVLRLYNFNSEWGGGSSLRQQARIYQARVSNLNIVGTGNQISSQQPVSVAQLGSYVTDTFELKFQAVVDLSEGNQGVRSLMVIGLNCGYQIRFGSVASDAPIPKTADYKLILPPVTIKWGRYVAP